MGCAIGTVRYILFFFNFLLAMAGMGILVMGIVTVNSEGSSINNILHGQLTTPAIIFSVVGACVFIFAFFGCCGALRESHCMICTYAVLLLTLFLLQVAVAVLAYTYKGQTQELVNKGLSKPFNDYNNDTDSKQLVDNVQQQLECCGSMSPDTPWGTAAPTSCYPGNDTSKPKFNHGCVPFISQVVEDKLSGLAKVAIIVGIVEVVGIIFALCLANSIRRSELRGYA